MADRIASPQQRDEDTVFDLSLRPKRLDEYIGQERLKENLRIFVAAARARREPLDHLLLYGPPGLGKTTLATVLANEMDVQIRVTSGPAILIPGELASILTALQPGDILFIDEIHRLSRVVEETLYPAMEDFALDMILGKGMAAKSIRLRLPRFTVIGATTRYAMLSSPLRDRFGATYRLDYYDQESLEQIVHRSARILNISIDGEGAMQIARRSRGTPRLANRLLKRVRDYAQVRGDGHINASIAEEALTLLEIDASGLDEIDRRLLRVLIDKYEGGPVGIGTLAAAISEEVDTVEEVYEPYLMQLGLLARTPRGRVATRRAYEHLELPVPKHVAAVEQPRLFE